MMLPTHLLVGLALAIPIVVGIPDLGFAALLGAVIGSVFPDLDLYTGHRRLLHYPTLYPLAVLPAVATALVWPTPLTVGVVVALLAAAVHCRMDIYGGGLELRPWEERSNRAVFDHTRGEWLPPRYVVAYDGSPGDFVISFAVGVPLLVVLDGAFVWLVVGALAIAGVYVLLRRRLAELAPVIAAVLPEPLAGVVPNRYRY